MRSRTGFGQFLSSLWVGIVAGFREMRVQPLRSCLSMTGVGLAIAALTALLSIIGGLQGFIHDTVSKMGGPGRFSIQTQSAANPQEIFQFSRSLGIVKSDGPTLEQRLPGQVKAMNSVSQWASASCGGIETRVYLNGIDREYLETIMQVDIDDGRAFEDVEYLKGEPVTMLGWELADRLATELRSRGDSLVGSAVLINGVRYRIIGRFSMQRGAGWRYASSALIPYHTMERFHIGLTTKLGNLQLQAGDPDSINTLLPQVHAAELGIHRGAEDFTFQLFNFIQEFTTMVDNITLLFSFVAGLSLGTGALGILNVMLASLAERVREVGVQKALGAKPLEIGIQFLAESITLSLVGGLVGMAFGTFPIFMGDMLDKAFHFRPMLDLMAAFKAVGITVLVGVLAGLFPAWKAMRLNPIDALRYE
jgi:putative ABC transport system permease protein